MAAMTHRQSLEKIANYERTSDATDDAAQMQFLALDALEHDECGCSCHGTVWVVCPHCSPEMFKEEQPEQPEDWHHHVAPVPENWR